MTPKRRVGLPYLAVFVCLATSALAQDAQRVSALLEEAKRLHATDKPRARSVLDAAQLQLRKLDDPKLIARARQVECILADAATAKAADEALAAATRSGSAALRARLLSCRGAALIVDHVLEAERDYIEAARLAHASGDGATESDALQNSGYLRYDRGATADALADFQAAYAISSRIGPESALLEIISLIANVYADDRVAQYDRAIEYYNQLLSAYERRKQLSYVAETLFNLGTTHQTMGDIPTALDELKRAAVIFQKVKKPDDAAETDRQIGITLKKGGRPAEALPWLDKALTFYDRKGAKGEIAVTRQARGAAFTKLGRDTEAIRDLEAVRPYFEQAKNTRYLDRIDEDLSTAYQRTARWPEAWAAMQRHVGWQRELFVAQRDEHAARLRVEFDTARRDEENRALARENALRSSALAAAQRAARLQKGVIALVVLLALTLAALFWRQLANARRLRVMAMTDELTRLPNRRHMMLVATDAFSEARRGGQPMSVITIDIDKFKRINDTWGHAAGDIVLRRVAHICRISLRPGDLIGRMGGEEFLVLARDASEAEAVRLAERLRAAVEAADFSEIDPALIVTISLGVSGSDRFTSFEKLAQHADELLYEAKDQGRNRVASTAV